MTDQPSEIALQSGEWHARIVDVERETARKAIGMSFTATNVGVSGERCVGQAITVHLSGAHWDLVGRIEEFDAPHTFRGKIVAIQERYDEWGEVAE